MGKRMKDVLLNLDSNPTTIGQIVKAFRKRYGFTQSVLSEITGIPETHISQIENDRIDLGVKRAEILAAALGVRPQDILFPEGVWKKNKQQLAIEKKAKKYLSA